MTPRILTPSQLGRRMRGILTGGMFILLLGLFLSVACGCETSTTANELPSLILEPAPPARQDPVVSDRAINSYHDLTLQLGFYTDEQLQEIARCHMASFAIHLLLSEEAQPALARLRELNPDMVFLGVMPVLSSLDSWDHPNWRERFPLGVELHRILEDHYARRTDGEVATMWENAPMVNPWRRGTLNQVLLVKVVNAVSRQATTRPGVLDGIFHDYTSGKPYLWPQPADPTVQVDLDGDGIGAHDDPEEREVWVAWQYGLVESFQEVFGAGFIQVANGRLPLQDPVFAGLLAGIHYERFPTTPWGYSPREGIELVILHSAPGYLTPRRGRTWNHVLDMNSRNWEVLRATALLTAQSYSFWEDPSQPTVDPTPADTGAVLGELVRSEQPDGSVIYNRHYERGTAQVHLGAAGQLLMLDFIEAQ